MKRLEIISYYALLSGCEPPMSHRQNKGQSAPFPPLSRQGLVLAQANISPTNPNNQPVSETQTIDRQSRRDYFQKSQNYSINHKPSGNSRFLSSGDRGKKIIKYQRVTVFLN